MILSEKAESQLSNECVRTINNTTELSSLQRDTCRDQLARDLDEVTLRECQAFINRARETRSKSILECQKAKFNRLWHKTTGGHPKGGSSNVSRYILILTVATQTTHHLGPLHTSTLTTATTTTSTHLAPDTTKAKWVKNITTKPLMEAQIFLLAMDPNYAVVALQSPKGEHTEAVEELRKNGQVLKHYCPLKPYISREEAKTLK